MKTVEEFKNIHHESTQSYKQKDWHTDSTERNMIYTDVFMERGFSRIRIDLGRLNIFTTKRTRANRATNKKIGTLILLKEI